MGLSSLDYQTGPGGDESGQTLTFKVTAIPAFITLVTIPLTWSISHGIGYGFVTYAAVQVLSLRPRDVHPLMYLTAAAFAAYFVWEGLR